MILALFFVIGSYLPLDGSGAAPESSFRISLVYLALACGLAAVSWNSWWWDFRLRIASHLIDIVFFIAFNLSASLGLTSPFFIFFVFLVLSASARWGWGAALATGGAAFAIYVGDSVLELSADSQPPAHYALALIRGSHMAVLSFMIAWFGIGHLRGRIDEVPLMSGHDNFDPPVEDAVAHLCKCLDAASAAILWTEEDEPWLNLAYSGSGGALVRERFAPDRFARPIVPGLESSIALVDVAKRRTLLLAGEKAQARAGVAVVHPDLAAMLGIKAGVVAPLEASAFAGFMLAWDVTALSVDHLPIARRLAEDVGHAFDRTATLWGSRREAETATRLSLARDLHDSVAQLLTGVSMQIKAVEAKLDRGEECAGDLQAVSRQLSRQQAQIFDVISSLRTPPRDARKAELASALADLAAGLGRQWNVDVRFADIGLDQPVSPAMKGEIIHVLREAVSNSVRHGRAKHIVISSELAKNEVIVRCQDDGEGFAQVGEFDDVSLWKTGDGPRSIHERVRNLGGTVTLSSAKGATSLTIRMPRGIAHAG